MKKQMMTALAVSAMMTLAMPFASFAAGRSCQTSFRPGNNCGYTGTNAVSMIQMQGGCVRGTGNVMDVYALLGNSCGNRVNGNGCGNSCDNSSNGSCLSGTNCGNAGCSADVYGAGSCSANTCGSNCQTSGNVSSIAGTSCGNFSSRR